MSCPLCRSVQVQPWAEVRGRLYLECEQCALVHLVPEQRPGPAAEHAHYGTHRNDPGDPGYRAFLRRLAGPLSERLAPGAEGLDYGSGPGPTLSVMLAEQGFRVAIYDPFFAADPAALGRAYDFVTCSEVVEHFHSPADEFDRLNRLLRPGGWLGVMTELLREDRAFADWHYIRDPTHVCFYRAETMKWIAVRYGWTMESVHANVVLFRKPLASGCVMPLPA